MPIRYLVDTDFEQAPDSVPLDNVSVSGVWTYTSGSRIVSAPTASGSIGAFYMPSPDVNGAYAYIAPVEDVSLTSWTVEADLYFPTSALTGDLNSYTLGLGGTPTHLAPEIWVNYTPKTKQWAINSRANGVEAQVSAEHIFDEFHNVKFVWQPDVPLATLYVNQVPILTVTTVVACAPVSTFANVIVRQNAILGDPYIYVDNVKLYIGSVVTSDVSAVDSSEFDFEVSMPSVLYVISGTQFSDTKEERCRVYVVPECIRRRRAKHVCRRMDIPNEARCRPVTQLARRVVPSVVN